MKIKYITLLLIILTVAPLTAQNKYFAGVSGSYLMPMGELSKRFKPGMGGSVYFGKEVSEKWAWSGRIEYYKFDTPNDEKLIFERQYLIGTEEKAFNYQIKNLKMDLTVTGVAINADYNLVKSDLIKTDLHFSFGVYNWIFNRDAYRDSLFAPDTAGVNKLMEDLKVPSLRQEDWSGGFTVGAELDIKIIDPVWFTLAANYRAVVGELWATLKLGLENVSMLQSGEIRAGFRAEF